MSIAATADTSLAAKTISRGWLRGATFDLSLIVVVAAVAVVSGVVTLVEPSLFAWVLFLDVWLLGYHHVASTFTRLVFDAESFRQNRFLVVQLPLIVLGTTLAVAMTAGYWVLPTVYLYWQWFHYTRQSYGIERCYRRKADPRAAIDDYATTRALYLLPLLGIFYRSYQEQSSFLGMDVKYLPVGPTVLALIAAVAIISIAYCTFRQMQAWWQGRLPLAHTLYVLSHHVIFLTGYMLIEDITTGWIVLNVWHNAQYILFVWWFNNNRFKNEVDPKRRFLSTLCLSRNFLGYIAVCLAISTVAYTLMYRAAIPLTSATAVPVTLVILMVTNFHHYVVDGIIWKKRRSATPQRVTV